MSRGRTLSRARLGTLATFALAGLIVGIWVTRAPALAAKLDLSEGDLGIVILVWGLGAVLCMQGLRGFIARLGSHNTLRFALPLCVASLILIATAPSYGLLLVAAAFFGMTFGLVDVGMNSQGSAVEQAYGRPLMNGMHAGWSLGAMTGGLLGAGTAALGLSFTAALLLVAIAAFPGALLLGRTYIAEEAGTPSGRRQRLPFVVYLIGALAFAAFMLEGSIADWSALYLHGDLGASEAVAALGYPLFEFAMLAGRLRGDRLRARIGTTRLLSLAGISTALAVGVIVTAPTTLIALAGFLLAGVAVCTVVPLTFSLAGSVAPGQSVAAVAQVGALGYGGLLLGPVVIGFLADAASLRIGLSLAIVLGLLIAAGARRVPTQPWTGESPASESDTEPLRLAA